MTSRYRHLLKGHEIEAADILDAYLVNRGARSGAQLSLVSAKASG
jgi:hypothetical protein